MTATLAQLIAQNNLIRFFCEGCRRCVTYDPNELAGIYGRDMGLMEIKRRLKCTGCGSRECSVQVALSE